MWNGEAPTLFNHSRRHRVEARYIVRRPSRWEVEDISVAKKINQTRKIIVSTNSLAELNY